MMDCAMLCIMMVLPALGGATNNPRWPFPVGEHKSMMRPVKSSLEPFPFSRVSLSSGNNGVKFSKRILAFAVSGDSKFTSLTLSNAK